MGEFFITIFKYFNAWLLIGFTFAAAILTEKLTVAMFAVAMHKSVHEIGVPTVRNFRGVFRLEVGLPESAAITIALYAPALAFAAIAVACASLPFCSFIPMVDNGADVLQVIQTFLLSEVFAVAALYALGTDYGNRAAREEMRSAVELYVPFMAFCASSATFLIKNGLDTDPFSLYSFSSAVSFKSISWFGSAGILLFVFLVLSRIPHKRISTGCAIFIGGEAPGFVGAPRGMLQTWAIFRSFIIIAIITYSLFPADYLGSISDSLAISWRGQALNFFVFWAAAAAMRLFAVPICWIAYGFAERTLPVRLRPLLLPLLVVIAMALIWFETIILSQEAASF